MLSKMSLPARRAITLRGLNYIVENFSEKHKISSYSISSLPWWPGICLICFFSHMLDEPHQTSRQCHRSGRYSRFFLCKRLWEFIFILILCSLKYFERFESATLILLRNSRRKDIVELWSIFWVVYINFCGKVSKNTWSKFPGSSCKGSSFRWVLFLFSVG